MAGPTTTAERGERQRESSGPPPGGWFRTPSLRTIVISALVLVLLAGGGVWVLYGSDWLRVERVSVTGTRVLTPDEVRAAAGAPLGAPLVSVDTAAIEARLRRALPRIDAVSVERSWPDGIGVKVTERTPVLVMEKGGTFTEVDGKGVRFATVPKAPEKVPVLDLDVVRTGSAAAAARRFGEDRLVRAAVEVADTVPGKVAQRTRKIRVRSYDDIALELDGGRTVAWGSAELGEEKARTLTALMKATPKARHFDVSAPTAPASSGS
ncbi:MULTISPECIES: cell division protein FtsQ/DivIB [unclassified Streptomyces]|uniref:cell division protein FtsQ/DivIB n=1 Tax=unclassified Streptomyces TaxID=2593676 RepID=UPI001369F69A|nr:FtsQ-type POTRA domain-containing protein [Streptomyces sp. SHP 1-2]MCW5249309.1 FtsQ-type POTRA domain-containing protein [Streptomyces sp. SHP 1-2]MYU21555.1 FtsQ-type POTRA domain-containing protein [Streptomyces sp. SID8352]